MLNYNKSFSNPNECLDNLKKDGVSVMRGLINLDDLNLINNSVKKILETPSITGSIGYYMKDPFKKTYDAFLLDKIVPSLVSNKIILNVIKKYLNDDIIISEVFLKHDLGDDVVYFPYHRHTGAILNKAKPFGCGIIIYLHDTNEGAFCYSVGTHKENLDHEPDQLNKSKNKKNYVENLRRINGKKGDIVIFDEGGFHGPEQPVKNSRTVIISGFRSKKIFENKTKTEIPILNSSLSLIDDEQKNALGLNNLAEIKYDDYHLRKISSEKPYSYIGTIFKFHFYLTKILIKLKDIIK